MREYLFSLTNKPDILINSILHKPLLQYMEFASYADKIEMIQFMQEHVTRFLHTRDGSKASVLSIGYGSNKERKIITKSLKGYIAKICKEEFGHFLILSIFTFVDDVVLVKNSILKEMVKHTVELCVDKYGRLCFLIILKGLTKSYFDPFTISLLEPKMIPDPANTKLEIPSSKKNSRKTPRGIITSHFRRSYFCPE